ncbi:MAG: hypothetical protein OEM32_06835, partial [Acidimicrobiia bacterium]|nr:hypothetical protein [Acidimicrobiia bacterium]
HLNTEILWWEVDLPEPIVGKTALAKHLAKPSPSTVTTHVHDVLANDEHLVALLHANAETPHGPVDLSVAEVIHFDDKGLMVKRQIFPSNVFTAVSFYGIGVQSRTIP